MWSETSHSQISHPHGGLHCFFLFVHPLPHSRYVVWCGMWDCLVIFRSSCMSTDCSLTEHRDMLRYRTDTDETNLTHTMTLTSFEFISFILDLWNQTPSLWDKLRRDDLSTYFDISRVSRTFQLILTDLDCRKQAGYWVSNLWNILQTSVDLWYLYMYLMVLRFNNVY